MCLSLLIPKLVDYEGVPKSYRNSAAEDIAYAAHIPPSRYICLEQQLIPSSVSLARSSNVVAMNYFEKVFQRVYAMAAFDTAHFVF